jgi:chromosome segregation protein
MRLKHLQLQGYKTFATKTSFSFPSGITAIVGPNGSGKSNIADAIRWVLGEQSYRTLRGKSTQDMIFSGSQSRPRAGMAEVTLTLDNSDGQLPVEFSEVTVGRRAHRDGQNEYLINGNRVRLRDITELLSQSGLGRRNYTIIGQGVVDAVLSLRAEERRELFEEAAGISHYRDKRADALRRLQDTQRNLERVHDIVVEIEPRLKRLQRQAERARQHDELTTHLERLLRTWYGYRWGQATTTLEQAQETVRQRAQQHRQRRQHLQALSDQIDQVRRAQGDSRRQLGDWHRQSSALHAQAEKSQRELAVLAERDRQLTAQREEHLAEIATLDARLSAQAERVAQAQADLQAAEQALARRQREAQIAQEALEARLEQRQAALRARDVARERRDALRADVARHQSRREALTERAAALAAQTGAYQAEIARLQNALDDQLAAIAQVKVQLTQSEHEIEQARQAHVALEKQRQALTARLAAEQADLRRVRETETEVNARFELLSQLRRDFAIYGQAARALLTSDDPLLRGDLHGVLAQLIQVPADHPPGLSSAVEAALGAYAGAIVVTDWQAAAGALRYLRASGTAGRVVLLPLVHPAPLQTGPGRGDAERKPLSAQVRCDDALRPLVERLLGRAYLVPDLDAAHAALPHLPAGALCVTPQGQVVRGEGAIEGGRAAEQASPLTQEREWSQLNLQRVELGARRDALQATVDQSRAALEAVQEQLGASSVAMDELRARQVAENTAHDQATRQIERLEQELAWQRSQVASAEADQASLRQRQEELVHEIETLTQAQAAVAAQEKKIEAELADLPTEVLNKALTAAQVDLAAAQQTCQGQGTMLRELQASLKQLEQERQSRRHRETKLAGEKERVAQRAAQVTQEQADLSARLEALTAQIEPAQARLAASEERLAQLDQDERQERARTREFEGHLTAARLEVQRHEDELARLRGRIEEDLGLVELELGPGQLGQTPLPLHPLVSKLPTVTQLPEGLEDEIKRLRLQLRRLGAVNPDAQADYQETLERHTFLQEQSADLVTASDALRQVIAEMDGLIEHAFRQTFEAVAAEFKKTFTTLFGGGRASLELTDPNDLTHTGVEIVAQPPGKRLQALDSLSGGERSLTAAALIFSILRVSPTPFCILDEVDAMLDEANVGRFRRVLKSLTAHTQIVVITHNRGTMDAADTYYGITMGADSVSEIISIKMAGDKIKYEQEETSPS